MIPIEGVFNPVSTAIEKLFLQGKLHNILGLTVDSPEYEIVNHDIPFFIAALAFTGREDEAASYFEGLRAKLDEVQVAMVRFYLALSQLRQGNQVEGRALLIENLRLGRRTKQPLIQHFAHQGRAFYYHMTSRFRLALAAARQAQAFAIHENYF